MKRSSILMLMALALLLVLAHSTGAEMQSDNYRIPTAVFSGGGATVSSTSYKTNSTLGQPSPLMDTNNPPYSDSYNNYPGFWYTVDAGLYGCLWDLDEPPDGDVDGIDLAEFIAGSFDENALEGFATEFGSIDCFE
jgi:hypothetical protein